ncbi:MAG: helix-turn-helix transcriptional regulator [Opitutales bacterium]|nr:helix-turn-helix transcriptional regulator [Opitutales bacterium]
MTLSDAFAQVLRGHRLKAGLSQEELGFEAQLHPGTISLFERGLRCPSLNTVFLLARAMNIPPELMVAEIAAMYPRVGVVDGSA